MLSGKTALVTGSTSGIGKAIATRLAREGCNVVLNGFGDEAAIEAERAGLEKEFGIKAGYSGADLTNPDAIKDMMGYVARDFGGGGHASAASATITPASRPAGSTTFRVVRRGAISTPSSSGVVVSSCFFLAFIIAGNAG